MATPTDPDDRQLSLWPVGEAWQRTRWTDPGTSLEAAESLTALRITATRRAILDLLGEHRDGLCDEDIALFYAGPQASPSGLRTRRSELVDAGLVKDSGRRTATRSGRATIIWIAC